MIPDVTYMATVIHRGSVQQKTQDTRHRTKDTRHKTQSQNRRAPPWTARMPNGGRGVIPLTLTVECRV
jgi:hypothetical protein